MPRLVSFLFRHALIGFGIAVPFIAALLAFDVAGLGRVVFGSPSGPLAVAVLTAAIGLTFASLQMGFAVMLLGEETSGRGGRLQPRPVPVRVPVRSRRHHDRF
ncbi:hypothetical protein LGR54_09540 [Ancylobacter sp. Lp-2]|uniref:hypothetical protein n=1 Tax=Ancylobacter sp. Lp-2 TaxID=2881339 RepID=UPI001E56778C|nr:hypothetical protein [Ancylobacter sp. Lp-2]MCB4768845.1 hypothetical protein [Ancylobacter sp. Lp-2]